MKPGLLYAGVVLFLCSTVAPASAVEWTGLVKDVYSESMVFVVAQGDQEAELWLGPAPSEPVLATFRGLGVGDTVKVTFDEEQAIALTIEVVQRALPGGEQGPAGEPAGPTKQKRLDSGY